MIDHPRIAVVFATMNRWPTAVACVRALAAQTRPPELVIVADNVSSDETFTELTALIELPFEFIVHPMTENLGNAGGVHAAMELAFSKHADAVWILDDDSWPRPDALESMLAEPFDPLVVRHPLQIDPATEKFTWPLQIVTEEGFRLVDSLDEMPRSRSTRSRGVWTGALISRHVRETIGPVMAELFIRGEDEEYPWRMERAGFGNEAIRAAIMDHPGPPDIVKWNFFGKYFFFERGLADWKLYYKVRNMVWLKRKQSGMTKALAMFAAYLVAVCRFEGLHRIPLLWKAFRHGWRGRLGKMR